MKKSLSLRTKTILSVCLFVLVFAALVVVATFCDLDISKILTKHSLGEGEYISHNGFALFFEAVGCIPFYIMISLGAVVGFWFFASKNNNKLYLVAAIMAVISVAALTLLFKDLFTYTAEYIGANLIEDGMGIYKAKHLAESGYILGICVVFAAATTAGVIALWKRVPKATNDKMIWWSLAILCTLVFFLVVHFVKSPIGRVRFRTMNYLGDTTYNAFTPWYVANGKQVVTAGGIVASSAETKAALIVASDTCKSFPSGHTFSAGMIYTLLALPYLSDKFNKKGVKLALWLCTVGYVALVAISRIVAGAHYMSDVLFGGTIAFVGAMIGREIFVCKGCHWFALFPKKKAVAAAADGEAAVQQEAPEQDAEPEQADAQEADADETIQAEDPTPAEAEETKE